MRTRLAALALALATAACGPAATRQAAGGTADATVSRDVTVFAAASLTDAFEQIGTAFEAEHPEATVRFNFAGSQRLATQIIEGAPADVYASADSRQMDTVRAAGGATSDPSLFAGNVLQIAVEPGNPLGITGLDDLARSDAVVVLAAEQVPAGRYARAALDSAGVVIEPASLEADVRAVLSKVALGEADAGIVYASDVTAAGAGVTGVEIPGDHNVAAAYPVALLEAAPNPAGGQAFIDLLSAPAGRQALRDAGFTVP